MNAISYIRRATRHRLSLLLLGAALLGMPTDVHALCGLDGAVRQQLRNVDDPEAVRALTQKIRLHATCSVCHLVKWGGPRNEYGSAINTLLTLSNREDPVRQRDAGRRMMDIPANPLLADSPTFGDLFQQGWFPARSIETPMSPFDDVSAIRRSGLQARPDSRDGSGEPSYSRDGSGEPSYSRDGSGEPSYNRDGSGEPSYGRDGSGVKLAKGPL